MNHPDVRILTIRRYAWTSWPRPVSGGPKLLVPSPQGVYSIAVQTKLSADAITMSIELELNKGQIKPWYILCSNFLYTS